MIANLPETGLQRVVIIGAGFAGLKLARKMIGSGYQVVLIDKENYHQFQPLLYQVATSGLEPSSIAFPLRKVFQKEENFHIRIDEVISIDTDERFLLLKNISRVNYDILILAYGADTNFFGNENVSKYAIPMKSVPEALTLRNRILGDYERALSVTDYDLRQELLDIVIVGGGPTGVEIAGALADMRQFILPKDYNELDKREVDIYLVDSGDKLLAAFNEKSSLHAEKDLESMGIHILKSTRVVDYDGLNVVLSDGNKIRTRKLIWAAGITVKHFEGMPESIYSRGGRIRVDEYNRVLGLDGVYAIGDCAIMSTEDKPNGDPQVAQVAMQQADNLARNLKAMAKGQPLRSFSYHDKGVMATIGRKKAVAEVFGVKFGGFFAWLTWLFVHLMSILGTKNKLMIFINWTVAYFTRDQSLRLILKAKENKVN